MQDCAPQLCLKPGKVPAAWIAACRQGVVLSAQAMPEALPQVFVAAAVKMRVRPPKNAEELYEVDQGDVCCEGLPEDGAQQPAQVGDRPFSGRP